VAERIVDVLKPIDVDVGGNGVLAGAPAIRGSQPGLDLLDHVLAVGQARKGIVLGFVTRTGLTLREFFRCQLETSEHVVAEHAGREHAAGKQRQQHGQQEMTGTPRLPRQISDQAAVVADKGVRNVAPRQHPLR
jgi:hypothetical protein